MNKKMFKMKKIFLSFLFFGVSLIPLLAQSHELDTEPSSEVSAEKEEVGGRKWGIKLGPSVGLQGTSNPLFRYHGAAFIEGGRENNALYAEIGYHARGFAYRGFYSPNPQQPNQGIQSYSIPSVFHNVGLSLGLKKRSPYRDKMKKFYAFAMRGEFNVGSNLAHLDLTKPPTYSRSSLYSNYIRPFVWGMDISGGIEKPLAEQILGFLEFTISPDLSFQYSYASLNSTGTGIGSSGGYKVSVHADCLCSVVCIGYLLFDNNAEK
jgi:hypothetical protein